MLFRLLAALLFLIIVGSTDPTGAGAQLGWGCKERSTVVLSPVAEGDVQAAQGVLARVPDLACRVDVLGFVTVDRIPRYPHCGLPAGEWHTMACTLLFVRSYDAGPVPIAEVYIVVEGGRVLTDDLVRTTCWELARIGVTEAHGAEAGVRDQSLLGAAQGACIARVRG